MELSTAATDREEGEGDVTAALGEEWNIFPTIFFTLGKCLRDFFSTSLGGRGENDDDGVVGEGGRRSGGGGVEVMGDSSAIQDDEDVAGEEGGFDSAPSDKWMLLWRSSSLMIAAGRSSGDIIAAPICGHSG